MIAGGAVDGDDAMTEVVELVKTNSTPSFGQLPQIGSRYYAVGAIFGNAPIICGGFYNYNDTCITYHQDSEWILSHLLAQRRLFAAEVKVNSTTLWILGGLYPGDDSTEFVIQGQTNGIPGPKLPYKLSSMCAIKFSENEIFVIGGDRWDANGLSYRNEVWIYDPQNGFARTKGPSMTSQRNQHSCSTMKDGKKTVIIAAGGYNGGQYLNSVERTPQLFTCLILAKIKFFVLRDTIFLLKYQITALIIEAFFTKKVFLYTLNMFYKECSDLVTSWEFSDFYSRSLKLFFRFSNFIVVL